MTNSQETLRSSDHSNVARVLKKRDVKKNGIIDQVNKVFNNQFAELK